MKRSLPIMICSAPFLFGASLFTATENSLSNERHETNVNFTLNLGHLLEPEVQDTTDKPLDFMIVENKPVHPACRKIKKEKAQYKCFQEQIAEHIRKNFRYPPKAKELGIQGKVYVNFVVDIYGYIKDVRTVKSVNKFLDEEAERIIKLLPRMKPAEMRGKSVPVSFTVPINFILQ